MGLGYGSAPIPIAIHPPEFVHNRRPRATPTLASVAVRGEILTSEYESFALDRVEVQTMNGHPAVAFQWFGLKPKAMLAVIRTP
jgi:hypothetical protein